MNQSNNPRWWTPEYDSAWERTKAAFRRDWDQTKHDFGGDEPDTDQDVDDTVKQAAGKQVIPPRGQATFEEMEPAYRFGFGAHSHYSDEYSEWDDDLEERLKEDWRTTYPSRDAKWQQDAEAIRYGWEHSN